MEVTLFTQSHACGSRDFAATVATGETLADLMVQSTPRRCAFRLSAYRFPL